MYAILWFIHYTWYNLVDSCPCLACVSLYIVYCVSYPEAGLVSGLGGHGDAEICSAHIKRGHGEAGLS